MSIQLQIHPSAFPQSQREHWFESLKRQMVPTQCLYESIGQASRWLAYAKAWSPIHRGKDYQGVYDRAYAAAWGCMDRRAFDYLALGCGDGYKDASFFNHQAARALNGYLGLAEISPSLLIEASQKLASFQPEAWVVDLASAPEAFFRPSNPDNPRRLISCMGMLPTLGYQVLLPYLSRQMGPEDWLLVSANLTPSKDPESCQAILTQYDNDLAMEWYRGFLLELGLPRDSFACQASTHAMEPVTDGGFRIQIKARLKQDHCLSFYGHRLEWLAHTTLDLFRSERHTTQGLRQLFHQHGLACHESFQSEDGEEAVYLLKRASA